MQLNITTDYAVRIMVFLCNHKQISKAKEISQSINVSEKYVKNILKKLSENGLVKIFRGQNGGYRLAKSPSETSMYEILVAIEPSMKINSCLDNEENCNLHRTTTCCIRKFYKELRENIENELKKKLLDDFVCG